MASSLSKQMPFTCPSIFFLILILFFTINYLRQMQNGLEKAIIDDPKTPKVPTWFKVVEQEMSDRNIIRIGLVNMDDAYQFSHPKAKMVKVHFDRVSKDVKWSNLFPAWINETQKPSKCPEIPMSRFQDYKQLDVVIVRVPCGLRNVFRLQLNLVVANLLVRSGRIDNGFRKPVFAVFLGSSCGPMWEIFKCDDLFWHGDKSWVYRPELRRIKQKVLMPVGTCALASPFAQSGEELWRKFSIDTSNNTDSRPQSRQAYVTVLHSSEAYVCGAIALAQSIKLSKSTKDLVLLVDDHISPKSLEDLETAGWKIKPIQRIRSPHSEKGAYNEWNYSKLQAWQLTDYDKVMFLDSDLIVTKNLDQFFFYPQLSAVGNHDHIFNSGVMLLEPSKCTFKTLMKKKGMVKSYNGGDQGFLNEMFSWWHRLPVNVNRIKFFGLVDDPMHRIPEDAYAVHYLGLKPWMCYRDYDCNWDKLELQQFASDSAHERWWRLYDRIPEKLREHCSLTPETDSRIQKYRSKAKAGNFSDGHWHIKVKDPRRLSN